jgi:putative MATE family efflux protein
MSELALEPTPDPPVRGDLTQGPLVRTLAVFALPVLLSNVLQTLNASINTVWIGQLLGEEAIAATATANIVLFLVFSAIFGIAMATTVHVGQYFGARDLAAMRRSFAAGFSLCLAISCAIAVLGWFTTGALLDLLSLPGAARDMALIYLKLTFLTLPAMTLTVLVASAMRGAGDSSSPLYFQALTVVLGIALNPLMIEGIGPFPKLGIAGSALASGIAAVIGCAGLIGWLYWRDLPLRLRGSELGYLKPRRAELTFLLGKGLPMGAQMLAVSGAGAIMIGLINLEGLLFAAAYGALMQLWNYIAMPAMAIGAAVSAMVAQHIGAGREERVDRIGLAAVATTLGITVVLIAVLLTAGEVALAPFLGARSEAIPIGVHIQSLAIWTYLPFGIMVVLFGTLRAYGVVYTQLFVLIFSMYLVRYGAYFALYPRFQDDALWYSMMLSSLTSLGLSLLVYFRAPWRREMLARIGS